MENAYTKTPAEALRHFQVTEEKGLSEQQVTSLREKHGKNGRRRQRRIGGAAC
jgi:Ca2+ transporting ATPase